MARKTLERAESEDFVIKENGKKVGTIRVKPSGLLWKPKGKHSWLGVSVEDFAKFAEDNGKEQKK